MKVALNDSSQQRKALKAVSTLHGIDAIAADLRDGRITVTGVVDPVDVVGKLRRLFGNAEIVSVGPANDGDKKDGDKKDGGEKKQVIPHPCPYPPPRPWYEFPVRFLNSITDNFSEKRIIDRGRHGLVYKGVQDNGVCIAVKKLHLMSELDDEEFINEFNNLMRVRHQNTIRLVGYCHHTAQVLVEHNGKHVSARVQERYLCSEYLEGGDLDKHLSSMIMLYLHYHF